ncbi:hypothetical protein BDK51DRAFT_26986 [Blyttiomyces helicus]|uniref:Uncharacterized protein n=1 Tax=Blyttiomyces helicus TaxID=388810 RepID=A0A4V1IPX6_9FUNG|nr:hypothetical protein BDK51DRAFT_26986 [Blyttiomyces helicus]|eukprot:RKO84587.1 hypothetical protein BDK51DRAFT_26986 [Blyttiomyces helicus]
MTYSHDFILERFKDKFLRHLIGEHRQLFLDNGITNLHLLQEVLDGKRELRSEKPSEAQQAVRFTLGKWSQQNTISKKFARSTVTGLRRSLFNNCTAPFAVLRRSETFLHILFSRRPVPTKSENLLKISES